MDQDDGAILESCPRKEGGTTHLCASEVNQSAGYPDLLLCILRDQCPLPGSGRLHYEQFCRERGKLSV